MALRKSFGLPDGRASRPFPSVSPICSLIPKDSKPPRLFPDALFAAAWPDLIEGRERIAYGPLTDVMATVPLPSALEVDPIAVFVFEPLAYFMRIVCLQLYKQFAH